MKALIFFLILLFCCVVCCVCVAITQLIFRNSSDNGFYFEPTDPELNIYEIQSLPRSFV